MNRALTCLYGLILAAGFTALPVQPAPKDGAICLQHQLQDLGYAPGPPDGVIGPHIKTALDTYLSDHPSQADAPQPDLSDQSAFFWCRQLGLSAPELQSHWPFRQAGSIVSRIRTDEGSEAAKQALLLGGFTVARDYFQKHFDLNPVSHFDILGADTPDEMRDMVADWARRRGIDQIDIPQITADFCDEAASTGIATRHLLAFCWHKLRSEEGWAASHQELYKLFAHEFTHLIQFELAADFPVQTLPAAEDTLLGPAWLLEGMAEYFADTIESDRLNRAETGLFWLYLGAYRFDTPLDRLRAQAGLFDTDNYIVGHLATRLLADRFGPEALLAYWSHLGRLKNRAAAFEATFGLTLTGFETEFEILRRDIGQARRFTTVQ